MTEINKKSGNGITAANNGLSKSGNTVQLGGNPLLANTDIDMATFKFSMHDTAADPFAGARRVMYFDPVKAAFRAGEVVSTQWNDSSIGTNSFASGRNTTASGDYSFAHGFSAGATADHGVAIGRSALGNGNQSAGIQGQATGGNSVAIGYLSDASMQSSVAIGASSDSTGDYSVAVAPNGSVTGTRSVLIGAFSTTATAITNSITNTIMLGTSSTVSTMVISGGDNTASTTTVGSVGIGVGNALPTTGAWLEIGPGTTTKHGIRFQSGTLLTTPVDGTIEFDGTHVYATGNGIRVQLT